MMVPVRIATTRRIDVRIDPQSASRNCATSTVDSVGHHQHYAAVVAIGQRFIRSMTDKYGLE